MKIENHELRLRNRDVSAIAAKIRDETGLAHAKALDLIASALGFRGGNAMMSLLKGGAIEHPADYGLSEREVKCLELVSRGMGATAVAQEMSISERSVDTHLLMARQKLGAATTVQAVARAVFVGVIPVEGLEEV